MGSPSSSQVGRLRQPPASKRKRTNIRRVLDQPLSSTTPPSPPTILILTPVHFSLPPSTAPPAPVEALAATCGSTARLKWGVCGVVWWAQCGHGVGTEFSTDAATSWCNQSCPAVTTAGANSTVSVIVARLFNEDRLPRTSVTSNDR